MKKLFITVAFAILLSGCATTYEGPRLGRVMDSCEVNNKEFNSYYNCVYNTWYTPMYNELKGTDLYTDNSDLIDATMNAGKLLKIKVNKGQMSTSEAILRWDMTRLEIDKVYNERGEARRARIMAIGAALTSVSDNMQKDLDKRNDDSDRRYCEQDCRLNQNGTQSACERMCR